MRIISHGYIADSIFGINSYFAKETFITVLRLHSNSFFLLLYLSVENWQLPIHFIHLLDMEAAAVKFQMKMFCIIPQINYVTHTET